MDRKVLAIFVILISCMAFITLGCAARKSNDTNTPLPTQSPTATPVPTTAAAASPTPAAQVTATPAPSANSSLSGIDGSWLNISGETDESLPEDGIPTPDANF